MPARSHDWPPRGRLSGGRRSTQVGEDGRCANGARRDRPGGLSYGDRDEFPDPFDHDLRHRHGGRRGCGGPVGARNHAAIVRTLRGSTRRRPGAAISPGIRPAAERVGAHRGRHRRVGGDSQYRRAAGVFAVFDYAAPLAATHGLQMLELVAPDGAIVISAEWPARFGYKEEWLAERPRTGRNAAPFCNARNCPHGLTLALTAVAARPGGRPKAVRGGRPANWTASFCPSGAARRHARAALPQSRRASSRPAS